MSTTAAPKPITAQSTTKELGDVKVFRRGDQIIIPQDMTYKDARSWLSKAEEAEEKVVAIHAEIPCYPQDGLLALQAALEEIFGFAELQNNGWFGMNPPMTIQVGLHDGSRKSAPMGRIAAPTWEGGYLETEINNAPILYISGSVKRRHEASVQHVIRTTERKLKEHSIYKGHAVRIDLSWMDGSRKFNPIQDSPEFMQVSDIQDSDLILSSVTQFDLETSFWPLITQTQACQENRIPLKHGALLAGPYGTGKTMTAKVTAAKCERAGWTFIYLKDVKHIAKALKLAELYAPAVVFAEDIDQVASGERTDYLNEILNTIDGVDTKGKPIVTVLTSNHADNINPALLRAGRIDTIIKMGKPDAQAAWRFVQLYAKDDERRSLLSESVDPQKVGAAMDGLVPAFIAEAVQSAKRRAILREGSNIVGKVTTEDLVLAAESKHDHVKMAEPKGNKSHEQQVVDALKLVGDEINANI